MKDTIYSEFWADDYRSEVIAVAARRGVIEKDNGSDMWVLRGTWAEVDTIREELRPPFRWLKLAWSWIRS